MERFCIKIWLFELKYLVGKQLLIKFANEF